MVQETWFRQSYGTLSKVTVEGDCSHEIKRHLLFGRKVMTNLDSVLWASLVAQTVKHLSAM